MSKTPLRRPTDAFWRGRRVLLTGHTGFKGSWLARWLTMLGAEVHGLALDPPTNPSLFVLAQVSQSLASDRRSDIRNEAEVLETFRRTNPSVVFHLAAQPLVRDGFRRPGETFTTNTLGTVNVLEAARATSSVEALVVITTDKVYLPPHLHHRGASQSPGAAEGTRVAPPHLETDPLGAEDPYGWSKVAAEHAVAAYRALPGIDGAQPWSIPTATARAGNVLGGGDWSSERLLPDCIRSFAVGEPLELRFPDATRPWQHVLDPLNGYLLLAEALQTGSPQGLPGAFNFGPCEADERTVGEVADHVASLWGEAAEVRRTAQSGEPHENPMLRLDSALAQASLGWRPTWGLEETLKHTVEWYRSVLDGVDAGRMTDLQIEAFIECAQ